MSEVLSALHDMRKGSSIIVTSASGSVASTCTQPVQGGPKQHGEGWDGMIGSIKDDTHPDGIMGVELQEEVSKYGDFCQMTYPNFQHFGRCQQYHVA